MCYIVELDKGFKVYIGQPISSPGDNDSFLNVEFSKGGFDTVDKAQHFAKANIPSDAVLFLNPVKAVPYLPTTWMSELYAANPDIKPVDK